MRQDGDRDARTGGSRSLRDVVGHGGRIRIESIPEADYHRLSYYQRWIRSITGNLTEAFCCSAF